VGDVARQIGVMRRHRVAELFGFVRVELPMRYVLQDEANLSCVLPFP